MLDVHRGYVQAGCDVISTNTWGLPSALLRGVAPVWNSTQPVHWMDLARRGLRLAREAVDDSGRDARCAVAFSINGDVDSDEGQSTIRLLARLFDHEPPDLILLETLTVVRPSLFATVQSLLDTGLPVWLSFRRCRHGLCSVYGQHWGGPEGDAFGRAAARFEQLGIDALMINCIPPDHVDGMLTYLRDFTDLPLGVYPNLGYYTDAGWRFEPGVGSAEYAAMALRWRAEGAQIIGGCCGVGPGHVQAARELLEQTEPDDRPVTSGVPLLDRLVAPEPPPATPWTDRRRRPCTRWQFPDLAADAGVVVPSAGSLMTWRHLYEHSIGAHQRCLDIGCGTGLLGIQLALNWRVACARDRHRRARRAQHRVKRLPQRRRRPHDGRTRRHLPVGARGALRGHRRVRRADPGRSRAARRRSPAGRLLGPHAARSPARPSCPTRSRPRASRTSCSCRSSPSCAAPSCSRRRGSTPASSPTRSSRSRPSSPTTARRSAVSRTSATPTTCASANATCSSATCWRSARRSEPPARP